MAKFWKQGLSFSCQQCGNCCTHEGGGVYATKEEFEAIADSLDLTLEQFMEEYTETHDRYVSIKSSKEGPCVFYKDGCSIYSLRPTQCRTYPFWPELIKSEFRWNEEAKNCAGMNTGKDWTGEEIRVELEKDKERLFRL